MPTTDAAADRAFTLRMPPDLAAALREQAQAHDRSQGAEVRTILREHLGARAGARNDTEEATNA